MADVEETIKRIQAQKGVVGVIVMDSLGKINIFLVWKKKCWNILFKYLVVQADSSKR